jgi:hypothetical protein
MFDSVCVATALAPATSAMIAEVNAGLVEAVRRNRERGFALLLYIGQGSDPPTGPARQAAEEMFSALRGTAKVVAVMMEGTGFVAAAKRSVLTWLTHRMIKEAPMKTFNDLSAASEWLVAKCKELKLPAPTSAALSRDVAALVSRSA